MAIVEMKRIELLAMRQDQRKLLKAMQKMGCVEVSPIKDEALKAYQGKDSARLQQLDSLMERLRWTIGQLSQYNKQKAPFMGNLPDAEPQEIAYIQSHEAEMIAIIDKAEGLEKTGGDLKGQLARLQVTQEQLLPWQKLDIPVKEIHASRDVLQFVGTMNKVGVKALNEQFAGQPLYVQVLGEERDNVYLWLAAHVSLKQELTAVMKSGNFAPAQFGDMQGTVQQQLDAYENKRAELQGASEALVTEWKTLSEQLTRLKIWFDLLQIERDQADAAQRTIGTGAAFLMRGWVPTSLADKVTEEMKKLSPTCAVEVYAPEEGDEPPVLLHNNKFASPFETVVTGFALPAPGSVDPTAVMAPFYALLFGMMLSDAGYGLVMALAIPLLIKLKKPGKNSQKLLWVLFYSAIATVFCGAVYNTWFGFNLPIKSILDPINDPMPVMVVCMGVGVIHLFAGLGVGMYMNVKRGKPQDAIFDQLSWMLLVSGLIMLVLGGTIGEIGKWMAIVGVAIILIWAGRAKSKNPFKRLISGLGALYGATSWISDILSYMRLFGMGLATGVIGMVINQLVGMVFSGGIVGAIIGSVLFVGAHTFNLGINALGAYVHSCRLQYIEFFGKFYEEGGVAFRPLTYQTRYVNIHEA